MKRTFYFWLTSLTLLISSVIVDVTLEQMDYTPTFAIYYLVPIAVAAFSIQMIWLSRPIN